MRRARSRERGAAAVEFALLAPLFFMVIFGMFNGGLAFSRKLAVTSAVREAVRYGATLPVTGSAGTCSSLGDGTTPSACWFDLIRDRAISSANGDLNVTWGGQGICVSFISTAGTQTRNWAGSTGPTSSSTPCFTDNRPATEGRVQVIGKRNTRFDVVLFGGDILLTSEGVARFEAVTPGP